MRGHGSYQIQFGSGLTPAVKNLIIANVGIFLVTNVFAAGNGLNLLGMLGLVPYAVFHKFFLWQVFSYMFLHGGFGHIFFNMLVLWMLGGEVERLFGTKLFYRFYFICGIGAGIGICLLSLFVGVESQLIPTVGASGCLFGIYAAWGMLFGDRMLLFFGIFPMKARTLMIGIARALIPTLAKSSGRWSMRVFDDIPWSAVIRNWASGKASTNLPIPSSSKAIWRADSGSSGAWECIA